MCTFCPTGGQTSLLNLYLPLPLEHNTGCYLPSTSQYAIFWVCFGNADLVRDKDIVESNK